MTLQDKDGGVLCCDWSYGHRDALMCSMYISPSDECYCTNELLLFHGEKDDTRSRMEEKEGLGMVDVMGHDEGDGFAVNEKEWEWEGMLRHHKDKSKDDDEDYDDDHHHHHKRDQGHHRDHRHDKDDKKHP
ncbi:hypothetical protein EON65_51155, partial [archaeon]